MRKPIFFIFLFLFALGSVSAQERNYEKEALSRIKRIHQMLEQQTQLPPDELLRMEMLKLGEIEPMIEDGEIKDQIEQTYRDYDNKIRELNEEAAAQAKAKEEAEIARAEEKEKQESLKAAQAEEKRKEEEEAKAKEEKKQRTTLIITGIAVAIALFVSNQLIQHLRNLKTQRSIKEMQQNATNQAGNTAKRKAEGEIKKEVSKATNPIRQKEKTAFRKAVGKTGTNKGNGKRISI